MRKIYLLLSALTVLHSAFAQPCSNLFFSEYIEGTSNNKALEIYNPTAVPVDLTGYKILNYTNGALTPSSTFNLSGTIAPGDVYVLANTQADSAAIRPLADTLTSANAINFNGNDVLALVNGADTLDRIGEIGLSTDIVFDTVTNTGKDHSFVRQPAIQEGTSNWSISRYQWMVYPVNTVNLGSHTMNACGAITDTLVAFVPSGTTLSESAGTYSLTLSLNAASPSDTFSVTVALTGGTGDSTDVNNYTPQTVVFNPGVSSNSVVITITDDVFTEPVETLTFALSNPTGGLKLGTDSVFTLTIGASDAPVQVVTISQITSLNSNLQPDSLGKEVVTSGTVYGINYRATGMQFMIHDATDGIQVFSPSNTFGYTVTEGDSVVIQGEVQFFNGTTQLANLDTVYKIGTGNLANPTVAQDLNETTESELVRLNNVQLVNQSQWDTTGNAGGFSVDITDGQNTWSLRIDEQTDIFKTNMAAPSGTFDVIGIGTQFDNSAPYDTGYQILPRYITDIIIHSGVHELSENTVRLYPNPNKGNFMLESTLPISEFKLLDLSGREVYRTSDISQRVHVSLPLTCGIYIAETKSGNSLNRLKVVVQQ